jgi:O-antigen/teichoic acid export membrane protein
VTNIWLSRASQWGRTVAEFALAQGFVQATGLLTGLIYVRTMPVEQYAIYALCLMAISVASVGSDLGITGALSYFWRKYAQSPTELAPMIALVRRWRAILLVGSVVIAAVMLLTSTRNAAISGYTLALCLAIITATAWAQMRNSVDILLVRLAGRQRESYLIEAGGSSVRFAAAAAMLATGFGAAWFGLLGGLLGALAIAALLSRQDAQPQVSLPAQPKHIEELRRYALPLMPSVVIYMVQDPLVLWLAAVRGGATVVAEVHALGRIAAIFALIGTFSYVLMTPRLARTGNDRKYLATVVGYSAMICILITCGLLAAAAYPDAILLLIGETYAHLTHELLLSLAAAGLAVLTYFVTLANRGRGWVALDTHFALGQLVLIGALCLSWRMSTAAQVLTLSLALNASALLWSITTMVIGSLHPARVLMRSPQDTVAS